MFFLQKKLIEEPIPEEREELSISSSIKNMMENNAHNFKN
jgi:hypothetical protein